MLWNDEDHIVVDDGRPSKPSNRDASVHPSPLIKNPVTHRMFNAQSVFLSIKAEPAFSDSWMLAPAGRLMSAHVQNSPVHESFRPEAMQHVGNDTFTALWHCGHEMCCSIMSRTAEHSTIARECCRLPRPFVDDTVKVDRDEDVCELAGNNERHGRFGDGVVRLSLAFSSGDGRRSRSALLPLVLC